MTTPRVLNCPRDGAALVAAKYEGDVTVDRCPTCGGIWLDQGELEQIQTLTERVHPEAVSALQTMNASINLARQKQLPSVKCPSCAVEMFRKEYAHCSLILIDVCPGGHGLWLDKGELQALEQFFEQLRREEKDEAKTGSVWAAFWGTMQ